jgi:DNA-binding response OmpR family regulator
MITSKFNILEDIKLIEPFHGLLAKNQPVKLSPTEYKIFKILFEHFPNPVPDQVLIESLFFSKLNSKIDPLDIIYAKYLLLRHVDNLRRKLRKAKLPLFIGRVDRYGYVLCHS